MNDSVLVRGLGDQAEAIKTQYSAPLGREGTIRIEDRVAGEATESCSLNQPTFWWFYV